MYRTEKQDHNLQIAPTEYLDQLSSDPERVGQMHGREREKTEKIDRMGNEDEQEQTGQEEWAEEAKSETIGSIQSGARGQRGVR